MNNPEDPNRLVISDKPTEDEIKVVQKGLEEYNSQHPYGELDIPTPDISLVLKDKKGKIMGGVITSMLTRVMHLEVLWVDKKYRGRGYGRALVLEAERIGKEKGYTASQTFTFSFQAPEFYQSIGYKVLGIFDGYTNGITEYVLMKRLGPKYKAPSEEDRLKEAGFTIEEDASEKSRKILHKGLSEYVEEQVGELRKKNPEIQIKLVLKNEAGQVIGGLQGYTTLKVVHIEHLWVHEQYRGQGFGKQLLLTAEQMARANGCISGLVTVLSFQAPEFFQKQGYEIFGVSDGYPYPIKDYYFIKRF